MDDWAEERWDRGLLRWRRAVLGGRRPAHLLACKALQGGLELVGFGALSCWRRLPGGPLFLIYLLALWEEEALR